MSLLPPYFLAAGYCPMPTPVVVPWCTMRQYTDFSVANILGLNQAQHLTIPADFEYKSTIPEDLTSPGGKIDRRRLRKSRTIFDTVQIETLEAVFARQQYLNAAERQHLARQLGLDESQIKVWFQNRRSKNRKERGCGKALPEYPPFVPEKSSSELC